MTRVPGVRARLREATGDLHAELDGLLGDTDFNNCLSYQAFITRQAAPILAVEHALDRGATPAFLADWPTRRRSDAIAADLRALGAPLPADVPFAPLGNADAELGALYVLEGSRLGAKLLVRRARESRDPIVQAATAFLAHGEGVPFWPTFLSRLTEREQAGLDENSLVDGARRTFGVFLAAAREGAGQPE